MGSHRGSWLAEVRIGSIMLAAAASATIALGPAAAQEVTIDTPAGATRLSDIGFNRSSVFGGRVGHWFDSLDFLGVAVDASHYRPDTIPSSLQRLDLYVTPISVDLMLRWPLLTSADHPKGLLQPYLTIGPAVGYIEGKDTTNFVPNNQYDGRLLLRRQGRGRAGVAAAPVHRAVRGVSLHALQPRAALRGREQDPDQRLWHERARGWRPVPDDEGWHKHTTSAEEYSTILARSRRRGFDTRQARDP